MTTRGWTSADLAAVERDERFWTLAEAAQFIGTPKLHLRVLVAELGIEPVGTRRQDGSERRWRRPRVYRAVDLIRAYDVLSKAA